VRAQLNIRPPQRYQALRHLVLQSELT